MAVDVPSTGVGVVPAEEPLHCSIHAESAEEKVVLVGTWVCGRSRADYDSFWSHVTRKVSDRIKNSS